MHEDGKQAVRVARFDVGRVRGAGNVDKRDPEFMEGKFDGPREGGLRKTEKLDNAEVFGAPWLSGSSL